MPRSLDVPMFQLLLSAHRCGVRAGEAAQPVPAQLHAHADSVPQEHPSTAVFGLLPVRKQHDGLCDFCRFEPSHETVGQETLCVTEQSFV